MHFMVRILGVIMWGTFAFAPWASVGALNSSDLLFHLSFEDGVNPEFARGSGTATVYVQKTF